MVDIRRSLTAVALVCLLGCSCFGYAAAGQNKEGVPNGKQAVTLNSDRGDYNEKEKLVRLIGNVKFTCQDAVMTSSFAKYHTDTQVADFQGNIKLTQPGTSVTGRSLRVYYGNQRAIFKGGVKVVSTQFKLQGSKESPKGGTEPAYLEADEFEYNWAQGIGYAKGNIRFRQGERKVFADKAKYDRGASNVEMSGNVRLENGDNDWLSSQRVSVDLTTNKVQATGQVMGRFLIEGSFQGEDSQHSKTDLPEPSLMEPEKNVIVPQSVEQVEPLDYPTL